MLALFSSTPCKEEACVWEHSGHIGRTSAGADAFFQVSSLGPLNRRGIEPALIVVILGSQRILLVAPPSVRSPSQEELGS